MAKRTYLLITGALFVAAISLDHFVGWPRHHDIQRDCVVWVAPDAPQGAVTINAEKLMSGMTVGERTLACFG